MNAYAKFYEIPSMILEVIKETKRYGRSVGRSDNVKTVYPSTNTVCGGYNNELWRISFQCPPEFDAILLDCSSRSSLILVCTI